MRAREPLSTPPPTQYRFPVGSEKKKEISGVVLALSSTVFFCFLYFFHRPPPLFFFFSLFSLLPSFSAQGSSFIASLDQDQDSAHSFRFRSRSSNLPYTHSLILDSVSTP
jgi:hypothetical protein